MVVELRSGKPFIELFKHTYNHSFEFFVWNFFQVICIYGISNLWNRSMSWFHIWFCFCVGISHLQYIVGYGSSFFFFFLCYFPIPSSLFNLPFFLAEIFLMYRRRLRESNFPTWGWYRKFQRGICCPKLEQSVAYLLPRLCGLGSWNKVPRGFRWI